MEGGTSVSDTERARLLSALAALTAERGYEEVAENEVAARAGLGVEALRRHFPDKEACARAAIDAILTEVLGVLAENYSADIAERDSYLIAIEAILELLAAKPDSCHVSFVVARQMGPPDLNDGLEAGARMLSAMLERLAGEGDAEATAAAARAALGGAEAVVRRELAAGRSSRLPELLPDFVYAATVPFLGQEEALRLARRGRQLLDRHR